METINRFIFIDDDEISNMLGCIIVKGVLKESEIQTFDIPEIRMAYMVNEYSRSFSEAPTILFLDINMPIWSGWDFLDNFEKLEEKIKKQFRIYMLSSSIDLNDKERSLNNSNVIDYVTKPLDAKTLQKIFSRYIALAS